MIIINWLTQMFNRRHLREISVKIRRSMAFKILLIGTVILLTFTVAVYYFERTHVFYDTVQGVKVENADNSSNIRTLKDSLWWAFVTSTTVGYGDYYPKSPVGRMAGVLLMFFGISLVGVITGNIASLLVERQLKEGRGMKDYKMKNHFIICGWKRNMAEVLRAIMDKNRQFVSSDIVLIHTADPEEVENLRTNSEFSTINYISGDYVDEWVLNRANLKRAKKVLVLADRAITGSMQAVDSRTVMAVITIKSISKTVYTCAELLDSKFQRYLSETNCDEIILTNEYSRSLIANASTGNGVSNIIGSLLTTGTDEGVTTRDIPKEYIGKTYDELFQYFMKRNRTICIGILENTGNFYNRKKEAIHEAQKTPDISRLVDNLKTVKELVANSPVINPSPGYIVDQHSRAIIIEGNRAS